MAIVFGFSAASLIRFGSPAVDQVVTVLFIIIPLYAVFSTRSLSAEMLRDWKKGVVPALASLLLATAAVLFLGFWLKASAEFSRLMTLLGLGFAGAAIVAGRALLGAIGRRVFKGQPFNVLLIVEGVEVSVPEHTECFDAGAIGLGQGPADPFVLDRLARCTAGYDTVVVACLPERRRAWSLALKGSEVRAELLVPELDTIGAIGCDHFAGHPTVAVSAGNFRIRDRIIKRALDVMLAIIALILLAPLMLITALAIRLGSRGPAFFVQRRVGRGNQLFSVYKFRSMRAAACDLDGKVSASRDDDRVTTIGRFIRATSIDELPQLINILRGDMSFVGPRPHAIGSLAGGQHFWEIDDRYHHRHVCKPGLTGLAQVRGFRGATLRREDLLQRLQSDLEYVNDWSLWRDLGIMASTMKVLVHRNAF